MVISRRYRTEILSDFGMLHVVSVPMQPEQYDVAESILGSDEIDWRRLPGDRFTLDVPRTESHGAYEVTILWSAEDVVRVATASLGDGAVAVQPLLVDTFSRGRIVLETSPPRVRRLVGVPLVSVWVGIAVNPVIGLVVGGGLVIVDVIIGSTVRGLRNGIERATESHGERIANRFWNRVLPPSELDVLLLPPSRPQVDSPTDATREPGMDESGTGNDEAGVDD